MDINLGVYITKTYDKVASIEKQLVDRLDLSEPERKKLRTERKALLAEVDHYEELSPRKYNDSVIVW